MAEVAWRHYFSLGENVLPESVWGKFSSFDFRTRNGVNLMEISKRTHSVVLVVPGSVKNDIPESSVTTARFFMFVI